jgi:hypothetical protein
MWLCMKLKTGAVIKRAGLILSAVGPGLIAHTELNGERSH